MDEVKIYEPAEIEQTPFPQDQVENPTESSGKQSSGLFSPKTSNQTNFPLKRVSHELISQALNTRSKKVRGQFQLTESGGFRIGNYEPGVSGEMVLTPAGQTAKNMAGQVTFAIDAETGDVIFLGEIRGGTIDIGNNFYVDVDGNVIANAIQLSSSVVIGSTNGLDQLFTASEDDVTGSSFTIDLAFPTIVHITVTGGGYVEQAGAGDVSGNGLLRLYVDSSEKRRSFITGREVGGDRAGNFSILGSCALTYTATLSKGSHTIKLVGVCDQVLGTSQFRLYNYALTLVTLGAVFG